MASPVDGNCASLKPISTSREIFGLLQVDQHGGSDQTQAETKAHSPVDSLPDSSCSTRVFSFENQEHKSFVETSQIAEQQQHSVQGNGQDVSTAAKLCDCGRPAVLKVAGPRSENNGLRYLCCDRFVFFGKKHKCCRFFEWVDCPRMTKEQKKEARSKKCKTMKVDPQSFSVPILQTRAVVRQLRNQCHFIQDVQPNIEINAFGIHANDTHQETTCEDIVDNTLPVTHLPTEAQLTNDVDQNEQKSLSEEHAKDFIKDESVPETKRITVTLAVRGLGASIEEVQDLELNIENTESGLGAVAVQQSVTHDPKKSLTSIEDVQDLELNIENTASGLGAAAVQQSVTHDLKNSLTQSTAIKTQGTGLKGRNDPIMERDFESSEEIPVCLCMRDAMLKIVNSSGPNKGKRFWVCSNSKPFYVKKKKGKADGTERSCKFFRWVDTPFVKSEAQKTKEKEKKRDLNKKKELALLT